MIPSSAPNNCPYLKRTHKHLTPEQILAKWAKTTAQPQNEPAAQHEQNDHQANACHCPTTKYHTKNATNSLPETNPAPINAPMMALIKARKASISLQLESPSTNKPHQPLRARFSTNENLEPSFLPKATHTCRRREQDFFF